MINTRVLLFAGLREQLQKSEISLEIPAGTQVREVLSILFGRKEAELWRCSILFAVNQHYVKPETELCDGDELVLIPPIAGG